MLPNVSEVPVTLGFSAFFGPVTCTAYVIFLVSAFGGACQLTLAPWDVPVPVTMLGASGSVHDRTGVVYAESISESWSWFLYSAATANWYSSPQVPPPTVKV